MTWEFSRSATVWCWDLFVCLVFGEIKGSWEATYSRNWNWQEFVVLPQSLSEPREFLRCDFAIQALANGLTFKQRLSVAVVSTFSMNKPHVLYYFGC
jgi:hypothetical protein